MKGFLIRYRGTLITLTVLSVFIIFFPHKAPEAGAALWNQLKTLLLILPPIFILLGLLDVWVPREHMVKLMGEDSGIKGVLLALVLGSAAAGPLYGAFPVAAVLMKKGVKFYNILIFIGAWSTTKIPMLLFEMKSLGYSFALSRLVIDIIGIGIIALLMVKLIPQKRMQEIYEKAQAEENQGKQI